MKRFWLVLLSLGLIVAFSTSAMAVDVKFSGEYYAAGMYLDKTSFYKSSTGGNPSTAFYYQRLRVRTDFVVSPGLTLITRADIMERAWGAARSSATSTALDTLSAGTKAENENIAFDWAYVSYTSPIGIFAAGYQQDRAWGTVFGDNSYPNAKITYTAKIGDVILGAQMGKDSENSVPYGARNGLATIADQDRNFYNLLAVYKAKTFEAGVLFKYIDDRTGRNANLATAPNAAGWALASLPYAKAQLGPVALQAEVIYVYGKQKVEDESKALWVPRLNGNDTIDVNNLSAWVDVTADFNKFYVGGSLAYVSGDDPGTPDKIEGGLANGGLDYQPCLIMFNADRNYWVGGLNGYANSRPLALGGPQTATNGGEVNNAYFAQLRAGVRPTDKFDIMASFSYAKADKTLASYNAGATWEGRDYGYEIDVTGTYKITNNLSYMLGAGYFMTGNYYKAETATSHDLNDDYMLINKLTLTF